MIPKFRAWDNKSRIMHHPDELIIQIKGQDAFVVLKDSLHQIQDYRIMQSTGLTDKNGVEIYEGDIVKVFYGNEHGETQVTYNYVMKNPFEYDLGEATWLIYAEQLEVVGNIYENKKMLGEMVE